MNVETFLENQSPPKYVIQCKKYGDTPKIVFSRAWQEKYKKENRTHFEHYISPLCHAGPAKTICTILACGVAPPT